MIILSHCLVINQTATAANEEAQRPKLSHTSWKVSPKTSNCSAAPFASYQYCNASLSTDERVADLVARLMPADFAGLLSNGDIGIPRLGVPAIGYSECLHGTLAECGQPYTSPDGSFTSTGCPTSFPHLLMLAGSFNRSLWAAVASAISDENRGLWAQGLTGDIHWSPNINPARDGRWGRAQETPSECPTLVSEFAGIYVSALQSGPDSRYLRSAATLKHLSAYDMESSDGTNRNNFDALVSIQDLVSYFWPPFRAGVKDGGAASIMTSYNALNGVPSCVNAQLMQDIVRDEWQFTGVFTSDCGAIREVQKDFNYTKSVNETLHAALHVAGLDTACDSLYSSAMVNAFINGSITMQDMQTAATHLLRVVFRLGLMDPPGEVPYNWYGPEQVDTQAHRTLAFDAAVQSIVLLQNNPVADSFNGRDTPLLPLPASKFAGRKIALLGPNANSTLTLLSSYHGSNTLVQNNSILAAMKREAAATGFVLTYVPGCGTLRCNTTQGFPEAVTAAQEANVAIVVVGLCSDDCPNGSDDDGANEGEGMDRTSLALPGNQSNLIRAVLATGTPTIVILVHGGPLSIDWEKEHVAAIIDAHYPGQQGGDAVTSILFGKVSPSGRLTSTVYPEIFTSMRNVTDMQLAAHINPHTGLRVPGITYLYYDEPGSPVLWPFGFGLSYTTFEYSWGAANPSRAAMVIEVHTRDLMMHHLSPKPPAAHRSAWSPFVVNVTNTGTRSSDVSVLAFSVCNSSSCAPGQPLQQLFDFQRAPNVAPGESVTLSFTGNIDAITTTLSNGTRVVTPGQYAVYIGGDALAPSRKGAGPSSRGGSVLVGTLAVIGSEFSWV